MSKPVQTTERVARYRMQIVVAQSQILKIFYKLQTQTTPGKLFEISCILLFTNRQIQRFFLAREPARTGSRFVKNRFVVSYKLRICHAVS